MNQCSAEKAGLGGCQAPVTWVIKAASMKMCSCGRHLNRVCLQLVRSGTEFMMVALYDAGTAGP